jgi:hypothetical protein
MGHHRVEGKTKPYRYHIDQFSELQHLIHKVMEYGEAMGLEMIQVITKTPREFPSLGSNRTKPGASLPVDSSAGRDKVVEPFGWAVPVEGFAWSSV